MTIVFGSIACGNCFWQLFGAMVVAIVCDNCLVAIVWGDCLWGGRVTGWAGGCGVGGVGFGDPGSVITECRMER